MESQTTVTSKQRSFQVQPKHHASKSRLQARIRMNKIIDGVMQGKNIKDVAISTGLSPKTAGSQATEILKKPEAIQSFISILEKQGVTDKFLAQKTHSLLNARKTIFFQKDGIVTDQRETEALETQRKTLELATKLKGHLKEHIGTNIEVGLMQMVVNTIRNPHDE
jgi:thymidine phosphorylase